MKRQFSPYELNHLIRHGIDPESIEADDQTPIEYLAGVVEFCSQEFKVSPAALIPRIETEELVELALKEIEGFDSEQVVIADVGTGCGAIAISVAKRLLESQQQFSILAADVSTEAIALAQENLSNLLNPPDLEKQASTLKIFVSDLLEKFPAKPIDLIVANLPYIPSERIDYLDTSVKDFEPHIALDGGSSGLELIAKMLKQAPRYLKKDGVIILEVDYTHNDQAFREFQDVWNITPIRDQFNRQRFIRLIQK